MPEIHSYAKRPKINVPCQSLIPAKLLLDVIPLAMQQAMYVYNFNMLNKKPWFGTVLTKFKNLTYPQELRYMRQILPRVLEGGYHFTFMGGIERVIKKMRSTVEGDQFIKEDNKSIFSREHVQKCMEEGKDLRNLPEDHRDAVACLPCGIEGIKLPYLEEFIKKYPYFVKDKK